MTIEQFSENLDSHRKKTQFGKKHDKLKRNEEEFLATNRAMCVRIFDGKGEISLDEYLEFRRSIQEMLWHYEFFQFDHSDKGHNRINDYQFTYSLLNYIPFQQIDLYIQHLQKLENKLSQECISSQNYIAFQYFLRKREQIIAVVMKNGMVDISNLRELADEFQKNDPYCKKTGTVVPTHMLNAFLCGLDLDGNAVLDQDEILGILNRKKDVGSGQLHELKKKTAKN